ncbi:MAG: hypothetical protein IPP74_11570 [Alphaproteobacteria bacterium]|nr:hypothetical protein [Alphaproteobacteria bacterium]
MKLTPAKSDEADLTGQWKKRNRRNKVECIICRQLATCHLGNGFERAERTDL